MSILSAYGRIGAVRDDWESYAEAEEEEPGAEGARMSAGATGCMGSSLYWYDESAMGWLGAISRGVVGSG
jgi:hypothetical protein